MYVVQTVFTSTETVGKLYGASLSMNKAFSSKSHFNCTLSPQGKPQTENVKVYFV